MCLLYVCENGSTVGIEGGKIYVKTGQNIEKVPMKTVSGISIYGISQVTTQCIRYCLESGIRISYFSSAGKYSGSICSDETANVERIKRQFEMLENEDFKLEMSRKIIEAKISNQLTMLRRLSRTGNEKLDNFEIKRILILKNKVLCCKNVEILRGYEGLAAKYYFESMARLVENKFNFNGRRRRPPQDPVNAMLSFGYSLLTSEIVGLIENIGLSPYAGFLHTNNKNKPSLACDLVEEWRAVIVDSVVLNFIMSDKLKSSDFEINNKGCYLSNSFRKEFLIQLENRMRIEANYLSYIDKAIPFRLAIWHQLESFKRAIEINNTKIYKPIQIR